MGSLTFTLRNPKQTLIQMAGKKLDFPFRPLLMEMLGVAALCYFGGCSCIMADNNKGTLVSVAFCHFFVLAALIYVGAATSGGHYNPAVTLGCLITGQQWWWHSILYIIFQVLGSLLGGILLRYTLPTQYRALGGLGYPTVNPMAGIWKALGAECIATFTLVFMVFGTAVDKRASKFVYAMCIGGSLGAAVLAVGPISGAALNPMRWFGPCLFGNLLKQCDEPDLSDADKHTCNAKAQGLDQWWIYVAGPLVGGALGAVFYRFIFLNDQETDEEKKLN